MRILVAGVVCLGTVLPLAAAEKPLVLSQAIDFLDNCYFTERGDYYSKEELAERLAQAKAAGFTKIYFRGTGGVSYYPSKVRPMFHGEVRSWGPKLLKTIHEYDTVAEYVKVAHELGLKLYYWEPVFDNSLLRQCAPGTPECEKYGEFPFADPNIEPTTEWKHRFAERYAGQKLAHPLGSIRLVCENVPPLSAADLAIYVAEDGQVFRRYEGAFTVAVTPAGKGSQVTIAGLAIDKPCIKLVCRPKDVKEMPVADLNKHCVDLFYGDGSPVDLLSTVEVTLDSPEDGKIETALRGYSRLPAGWGIVGPYHRTLIIRAGLFDRYAKGWPEFACKASRDRLVAIVKELYERYPGLDGISFSIRTHSQPSGGTPDDVGPYPYGFSEPIVEEYRKRYGSDITRTDYDVEKFLKLRGEYFTQMLREVSQVVHAAGGELQVMAPVRPQVGPYNHGATYPVWNGMNIDNFFDIATWAKEGLVDAVLMLGTGHRQAKWTPEWDAEVEAFRAKLAGTRTRLSLHYLINGSTSEDIAALLPAVLRVPGLDEVEFYEEHGMFGAKLYDAFTACVRETPRPLAKVAAQEK
jgi:hypothetical protein